MEAGLLRTVYRSLADSTS